MSEISDKCKRSKYFHSFSGFYDLSASIVSGSIVQCGAGIDSITLCNNGDIVSCPMLPAFGNIRNNSLESLLRSELKKNVKECWSKGGCAMSCMHNSVAIKKNPFGFMFEIIRTGRIYRILSF
ncbi:MAG: hypothetical protein HQK49_22430 [Oligoflexia bacterium]|nr:hypothetical protein [Oligoflexia bacterium]